MADVQTEAATTLAVRLEALGQCETCGATWDLGEVDPDDEDALDELMGRVSDVMDDDLQVFDDDASMRDALARVIGDAASEKPCGH